MNLTEFKIGHRAPLKDYGGDGGEMPSRPDISVLSHLQKQRYRLAILALMEDIRRSNDEGIQELRKSTQESNSLSEAVQEALELRYCWRGTCRWH